MSEITVIGSCYASQTMCMRCGKHSAVECPNRRAPNARGPVPFRGPLSCCCSCYARIPPFTTIVAIGGGHCGEHADTYNFARPPDGEQHWPVDTLAIDQHILSLAPTRSTPAQVLLLPTATECSEDHDLALFVDAFKEHYQQLGADVDVLELFHKAPSSTQIASQFVAADIVYVSGGATHALIRTWLDNEIVLSLNEAAQTGTIMVGSSAGAISWFTSGYSDDAHTGVPHSQMGLGWLPFMVCPNWNTATNCKESFKDMLSPAPGWHGFAIDELAALVVSPDKYEVISADDKAWVYRCYWKDDDTYLVEPLPPAGSFSDLTSLNDPNNFTRGA